MPEMQVAVRLGRETGEYAVHLPGTEVVFYDFLKEIQLLFFFHKTQNV